MMKAAILAAITLAVGLPAVAAPRVVYTKEFPGSVPAYVSIAVEQNGATVYKEAVNDEYPLNFRLDPSDAAAVFRLAEKMDRFRKPLESGLNVAKMGVKTFRYEDGDAKSEAKFNYSQDEDAKLLHDFFERITETAQIYMRLERTVKYDKLGVNQELLGFEAARDRNRIVAPQQFLPLLDRVAKNESYLHMARERAARLGDTIRAKSDPKPE